MATQSKNLDALKAHLATITDLQMAEALLEWDQHTNMPTGGAIARAEQVGTLRRLGHERLISDLTGKLLEAATGELDGVDEEDPDFNLVARVARQYEKLRQVPTELIVEIARVTSRAQNEWMRARSAADFSIFLPHLEQVMELKRRYAQCYKGWERIYDPLLDDYEPGMSTGDVEVLFGELKEALVPLVRAVAEQGDGPDDACLKQRFDPRQQWEFGVDVLKRFGFDFDRGRQDYSAHPFTTHFSSGDVRLTTRVNPEHLSTGLFGTLHEGGHAMYEQGVDPMLDRSPLAAGCSLGLHESQSRLWENIVGRSRGFWTHFYPQLQERFATQLGAVDLDTFYRAVNRIQPSLIRVEADEVTYNLHVLLRFELENELLEERVRAADLPQIWNERMQTYLGVTPPNDAVGVLQDVHWSMGLVGYFATYTLGNVLSVQIYERALAAHPEIPERMGTGEFGQLHGWLRSHLYRYGKRYLPGEMIERVTGGKMDVQPYVRYLQGKLTDVYGIQADGEGLTAR